MLPSARSEEGFALPFTVFVIAIITVMLASILTRVAIDRRIAESASDGVDAVAIAQSGLQTYLAILNVDACYRALRPVDGDSVRINVTGGFANVIAQGMRRPTDTLAGTWTYIVRSTGFVIEPTMGSDPQAKRTVAQFARWQRGYINTVAAYTVANGLAVQGIGNGSGEFLISLISNC